MKCKDIANKYGVTAMSVGRLRKKINPNNSGGDLTEEEIEKITNFYEELESLESRKELEKAVEPDVVDAVVSYVQKGAREVECKIRENGKIITVPALIPTSTDVTTILNKSIKLERIEKDEKKYYRHISLARVAWPKGYGSD